MNTYYADIASITNIFHLGYEEADKIFNSFEDYDFENEEEDTEEEYDDYFSVT